jgi:hypothetical protein
MAMLPSCALVGHGRLRAPTVVGVDVGAVVIGVAAVVTGGWVVEAMVGWVGAAVVGVWVGGVLWEGSDLAATSVS